MVVLTYLNQIYPPKVIGVVIKQGSTSETIASTAEQRLITMPFGGILELFFLKWDRGNSFDLPEPNLSTQGHWCRHTCENQRQRQSHQPQRQWLITVSFWCNIGIFFFEMGPGW